MKLASGHADRRESCVIIANISSPSNSSQKILGVLFICEYEDPIVLMLPDDRVAMT